MTSTKDFYEANISSFVCVIKHGRQAFVIWISRDKLQNINSEYYHKCLILLNNVRYNMIYKKFISDVEET